MNTNQEPNVLNDVNLIGKHIDEVCKRRREELGLSVEELMNRLQEGSFYNDEEAYIGFEEECDQVFGFYFIKDVIDLCNILQIKLSDLFKIEETEMKTNEEVIKDNPLVHQTILVNQFKDLQYHLDEVYKIKNQLENLNFNWLKTAIGINQDLIYLNFDIEQAKNETEFNEQQNLLNELLNELNPDDEDIEKHILYPLLDKLGNMISEYEKINIEKPNAKPNEVLEELKAQQGLSNEEFANKHLEGDLDLLNKLLTTDKSFDKFIAKYLAKQFNVNEEVFYLDEDIKYKSNHGELTPDNSSNKRDYIPGYIPCDEFGVPYDECLTLQINRASIIDGETQTKFFVELSNGNSGIINLEDFPELMQKLTDNESNYIYNLKCIDNWSKLCINNDEYGVNNWSSELMLTVEQLDKLLKVPKEIESNKDKVCHIDHFVPQTDIPLSLILPNQESEDSEKEDFTHEEVFGSLDDDTFTYQEALEYLEPDGYGLTENDIKVLLNVSSYSEEVLQKTNYRISTIQAIKRCFSKILIQSSNQECTLVQEPYSIEKALNQEFTEEFLKELEYHWSFIEPWLIKDPSNSFFNHRSNLIDLLLDYSKNTISLVDLLLATEDSI